MSARHRRLQSCVGTQARLGYAAFDVQCILSLHCTLYIRLCMHILYAGDHMSSHPVLMIRVRMIQNNSGNARVCPGLQASTIVAEAVSKIFALVFNIDL